MYSPCSILCSAFLVNSSDRIIRVFDGQIILACKGQNAEPEPIQKLQDLVNRRVLMHAKYDVTFDETLFTRKILYQP